MLKVYSVVALGLFIATFAQAAQNDNYLIVPDRSVGLVTRDASEDSLRTIFGTERVRPRLFWIGEGYACKGSRILFEGGESLDVAWLDLETRSGAVSVQINGESWRTREGVHLGMSLTELERINGGHFVLSGFGWDYGGGVTSWDGGRLQDSMTRVRLHFAPDRRDYEKITRQERDQVSGDKEVRSAHPAIQKLNPRLQLIKVQLDQGQNCESFFAAE